MIMTFAEVDFSNVLSIRYISVLDML